MSERPTKSSRKEARVEGSIMTPPAKKHAVANLSHVLVPIWGEVPAELDKLVAQGFGGNRAEAYYWLAMAELRRLLDQRHEREMRRR